ncbi:MULTISPECIES: hypothetical protein [Clavibacter]|uniref:Uncharacterized protein n=1 Tax=Clavibacter tessellarius TaxID=31965 RepID=A0A154UYK5_9MICO|nr:MULTISPECIES: hypothetical protein [Clavibacter]KZC94223.1 hypothetical protein AWH51_14275 [Clavibacter michiganensis subsp. tessellarius]MDA3804206.1 hypothetical protein [Clavibacter sp. CT19]
MPVPPSIAPRVQRVIRGLAASTTATFVAALFHEAGGGAAPSWAVVAFGLALASLVAIALAGTRASLWRLTAAVGVSQLLFHGLFTAAGDASGTLTAADPHAGMAGHGALPLAVPGLDGVPVGTASALDAGMLLSHGAALAVTVLALRHGEAALRALVRASGLRVLLALAIPFLRPDGRPADALARIARSPRPLRDLVARIGRLRHRGPPRVLVAA